MSGEYEYELAWSEREQGWVELEDQKDYILEEDRELVNKYIEKLQERIRGMKRKNNNLLRVFGKGINE